MSVSSVEEKSGWCLLSGRAPGKPRSALVTAVLCPVPSLPGTARAASTGLAPSGAGSGCWKEEGFKTPGGLTGAVSPGLPSWSLRQRLPPPVQLEELSRTPGQCLWHQVPQIKALKRRPPA